MKTFIAHRGLHNDKYPENTISAFKNALKNNLPLEFDIQLTKDNELVVFHDRNIKRMTGIDRDITDISLDELQKIKINNSNEYIPTLEEVLALVNGQVLLDIEIKTYSNPVKIVNESINALESYKGEYIVKSFNPFISYLFKRKRSNIKVGVLTGSYPKNTSILKKNFLRYFKYFFFYKPDFICYNIRTIDDKVVNILRKNNIPLYLYTIDNKELLEKGLKISDNLIFENLFEEGVIKK